MKTRYVARLYRVPGVPESKDGSVVTIQAATTASLDTNTQLVCEVQGDKKEEIVTQLMRRADQGPGHTDDGPGNADVGNDD